MPKYNNPRKPWRYADQQWVADLTYIQVASEWRYLATVVAVCSGKIVGWSLGQNKTAGLTLRALKQALRTREPKPGMILY